MSPAELIAAALRRERLAAGLSLSALAEKAGLAKSTLSMLESGKGNPSTETLWNIATALGIPYSLLFEQAPDDAATLIRVGEGFAVPSDSAAAQAVSLSTGTPGARRDIARMTIEPGAARVSTPHTPGTREHVIVCAGRAEVGPDDRLVTLGPGDYYAFPGDVPHRYRALEPGTILMLVMEAGR